MELKKGIKKLKRSTNKTIKKLRKKEIDIVDSMKMEIASELGLTEQIKEKGWDSLSPKVTGKIGGIISQKMKKMK